MEFDQFFEMSQDDSAMADYIIKELASPSSSSNCSSNNSYCNNNSYNSMSYGGGHPNSIKQSGCYQYQVGEHDLSYGLQQQQQFTENVVNGPPSVASSEGMTHQGPFTPFSPNHHFHPPPPSSTMSSPHPAPFPSSPDSSAIGAGTSPPTSTGSPSVSAIASPPAHGIPHPSTVGSPLASTFSSPPASGVSPPTSSAFPSGFGGFDSATVPSPPTSVSSPHTDTTSTPTSGMEGCPVCVDGILVKHLHYGGKACYSCRGFFRRAVQTKRYTSFKCKGEDSGMANQCVIESKSRKSCKHCRFQRCLRTGMSINLVMNEEERRDRIRVSSRKKAATMFSQAYKMTSQRIKTDSDEVVGPVSTALVPAGESSSVQHGLVLPFSEGEKRHLLGLLSNLHNQNNSRCYEFFAKDLSHLQSFVDLATHGKPVTPSYMKFMGRLNEVAAKTFCFSLTEMSAITPYDRMTLIQKNFKLIISLQVGCFFSDANFPVFFLETLNYGRRYRETNPSVREVHNRLQNLLLCYKSNNESMKVSAIQARDHLQAEHEQIHGEILTWLGHGKKDARSDDHLNILLVLIMLFDPASVDFLEDRAKVERIHAAFVRMLGNYLGSICQDQLDRDEKFRTGMMMVSKIKRMQKIQEERGRWFSPQKLLASSKSDESESSVNKNEKNNQLMLASRILEVDQGLLADIMQDYQIKRIQSPN